MNYVTNSINSALSRRVSEFIQLLFILAFLLIPVLCHASVTFVWVPNDGSSSSGVLTIDAPGSGYFSLPQTAVTSFEFSFRPGLSVNLNNAQVFIAGVPIVSFDGNSLDYGAFEFALGGVGGRIVSNSFLSQQLGSDVTIYDIFGQNIRVRGNWIRVDIAPPEPPPLPRGILSVIDIRPIIERHDIGNALGLAYNPNRNVIYLSHGSDPRGGFIYTLDTRGNLLSEFNFQTAYRAGFWPTSLTYDSTTGHLFVYALSLVGITNLVEMTPDGSTIFGEVTIPGGGGVMVRDDGIWQTVFANDAIRHYTRSGEFIEDVSLAASFPPGFPGPESLTSSFKDGASRGFFVVDHFGQRIVEVDEEGHEIAAVTTATLGDPVTADGRGLAIATDLAGRRIFLQGNNKFIFVLSPAFMKIQNVNSLVHLREDELITQFDPTPVLRGPAGTFQLVAKFDNVSDVDICSAFFQIVELPRGDRLEGVWLEPTGQQVQGFDQAIIGHQPFLFRSGTDAQFKFVIDLSATSLNFFVNLWGTPQNPGKKCP